MWNGAVRLSKIVPRYVICIAGQSSSLKMLILRASVLLPRAQTYADWSMLSGKWASSCTRS